VRRVGSPCLTVSLSHSAAKRFVRSKATMECCEPVQSKPFLTYFLLPPPLSICLDWKSSDCLMEALTNSPLTNTVRRIARGCASFVIRRLSSSFVVCCLLVADDLNLFVCLFACLLACLVREGVPKALVARFVGFVRSRCSLLFALFVRLLLVVWCLSWCLMSIAAFVPMDTDFPPVSRNCIIIAHRR